jgi:hypothetical protein
MAAPKGNKFALFNKGGQPPKYKNADELIEKLNEYFESYLPDNEPVLGFKPTTVGLALYLGFADRRSIYDYRDRSEEYSYIIKKALSLIEMKYEQMLESKTYAGAIFALKNMGWTDSKDITSGGEKIETGNNFFFSDNDFNEEE